jgi:hypothetical protein
MGAEVQRQPALRRGSVDAHDDDHLLAALNALAVAAPDWRRWANRVSMFSVRCNKCFAGPACYLPV